MKKTPSEIEAEIAAIWHKDKHADADFMKAIGSMEPGYSYVIERREFMDLRIRQGWKVAKNNPSPVPDTVVMRIKQK